VTLSWPLAAAPDAGGDTPDASRIFSVPLGAGAGHIARDLKAQGFIASETLFKVEVLLSGNRGCLKAGEYEIPPGAWSWGILAILSGGQSMTHPFTVPEGFSTRQIASRLQDKGLADGAKFLALVRDPGQARRLSVSASSLEGYLFPDTYQIPRGFGEARILALMVARFHERVPLALLEEGRAHGFSPHQVLTLASIVEREARVDAERAKVASVFVNRLARGQRLESCATVRYATGKLTGPVLDGDLYFRSPYNTYRHSGLPPGPICSPGLKSIQAAAEPAQTGYLFFVVGRNGEHVFSRTFDEHKQAKFRYKAKVRAGVIEE
jgi:UPF0755 protein